MDAGEKELAKKLMRSGYDDLSVREQQVLRQIAAKAAISRNVGADYQRDLTFGERVADRVAAFGGSWTFIGLFLSVMAAWIVLNVALIRRPPDPYPFILLNLCLSLVAAIQAPIIMMSQNRQAAKDRLTMEHDYEVNLKAELEIMSLHEKVDDIRMRQLNEHFARIEERLAAIEAALQSRT